MSDIEIHPAAALFPLLPDDELQALADDIKRNGLIHALVRDSDGLLLDGRNRLAACALVGVDPVYVTYEGDPIEFVIGANINRRHLTAGQRAFIASDLANLRHGSNQFRTETEDSSDRTLHPDTPTTTKAQAAKRVGTTESAISKARVIEKEAPELVADVKAGKESLDGAYNKATEARAAKAPVVKPAGGFVPLIDDGLTVAEAVAEAEAQAARARDKSHKDTALRVLSGLLRWASVDRITFDRTQPPAIAEALDRLHGLASQGESFPAFVKRLVDAEASAAAELQSALSREEVTSEPADVPVVITIDELLVFLDQRNNKPPTPATMKAFRSRLDDDQLRRFLDIVGALVGTAKKRTRLAEGLSADAMLKEANERLASHLPAPRDVFDSMTSLFHSGRNADPRAHGISVWLNSWRPAYKVADELEVEKAEREKMMGGRSLPKTRAELEQKRDAAREQNRRMREAQAKRDAKKKPQPDESGAASIGE